MSPAAPAKLRLVRGGEQPGAVREASRWKRLWVWAGLCAVGAAAIVGSEAAARRHAVRSIPEEQRAAIFQRTLDELQRSCGGRPRGALEEHCRELASFLSQFDECRGECEAVVQARLAPDPTR